MRNMKYIVALFLALLVCKANLSPAENLYDGASEDPWSSTTVTHIEYNPWGLVTIRVPKIPPRELKTEKANAKESKFVVIDLLWPLIGIEKSDTPEHQGLHTYILQIPFYNQLAISRLYEKYDKRPRDYNNPFDETWQVNQPLISGMDFMKVRHGEYCDKPDENIIYRMRILDSLVFCLYEAVNWTNEPGPEYVEWLNVPMVTTYARKRVRDQRSLKILKTPFTTVLTQEKQGNHRETHFLDLFLGTVYESDSSDKHSNWTLVDIPFAALASSQRWDIQCHDFSVLTVGLNDNWLAFRLWRERKSEDGKITRDYGGLPLLGPMWSTIGSQNGDRKIRVFPRIFGTGVVREPPESDDQKRPCIDISIN